MLSGMQKLHNLVRKEPRQFNIAEGIMIPSLVTIATLSPFFLAPSHMGHDSHLPVSGNLKLNRPTQRSQLKRTGTPKRLIPQDNLHLSQSGLSMSYAHHPSQTPYHSKTPHQRMTATVTSSPRPRVMSCSSSFSSYARLRAQKA